MKSREEYIKPYQDEFEQFVEHVADVCKAFGYKSISDAYDNTMNDWLLAYIDGIYDYEKQLIRAHRRYDRIVERLASKNKYNPVVAEELLEMKRRDERVRRYLEEANSRYDEKIDELVSKYKTDDGGNNNDD